jgi:hypothetical protein
LSSKSTNFETLVGRSGAMEELDGYSVFRSFHNTGLARSAPWILTCTQGIKAVTLVHYITLVERARSGGAQDLSQARR